ncbi:hypothetical protein BpHYR1_010868 [Brachionus plicatilis]|uniref:Uncharacterized protein n=1 Tax=Brachionus plicatilis TaxID=10195 RepID=A0A3M7RVH7_BRAPC|nr:hypothetical protein BpHYR1_010868 [Brachionus plicatilis]
MMRWWGSTRTGLIKTTNCLISNINLINLGKNFMVFRKIKYLKTSPNRHKTTNTRNFQHILILIVREIISFLSNYLAYINHFDLSSMIL